jgi:acylphosphatase
MNKRLHAYYSGDVQGVGFRYSSERTAASLELTGWVKNLKDGRVELVCEGNEASIKEFLQRIETMFGSYIRDRELGWDKATGEFGYFDIRF